VSKVDRNTAIHTPGQKRKSPILTLWLLLAIALAFALRVWRLDVQDIWWDEARNIDVALRPITAIPFAPELDIHPPGYFILLHLWTNVAGHTAFATRFFSTWFGVLLIPLVYALARRLNVLRAGIFAALYLALAPFLIGEAQETRMYTLAFVLLTLTAIALWETLQDRPHAWIALGVLTAASVLVHYSTVFVLIALYLYAYLRLLQRPHPTSHPSSPITHPLARLTLAGLLSVILFLPQAPRAYQQIAPYGNPNLVVPTLSDYLTQLWHAYTLGIPAEGPWVLPTLEVLAIITILGAVGYWGKRLHRPAFDSAPLSVLTFLLLATVLPILLYYAVLVQRATFAPRYISFVLPFLALLVGAALAGWWQWHRLLGGSVTLVVVVLLALGIRADQFNPHYFREDTSGLARWLVQHAGPEDVILIDVPYPLGFYYPRYSKNPDQPPAGPDHLAPAYYLFVDIHHVDERLNQLAAGKQRVFWVQWFKSDTDPRGVVDFLLRKYGVHAGEHAFRGYRVDWYRMPQDVHYRVAEDMRDQRVMFGGRVATVAVAAAQAPPVPADILRASDEGLLPRPVWAVVDWQKVADMDRPYKVSARLSNPLDQVVAQDDRRLVSDRHLAIPYWEDGETARNVYLLRLPLGTPPGVYTLTLRVYDPESMNALSAQDAQGHPLGPDPAIIPVRVRKAETFPPVEPVALEDAPLALVEYRVDVSEAAPGTIVPISLLWVKQARTDGDPLQVQVMLLDSAGRSHSLAEMPPIPWYPTERWAVGEVVRARIPWRVAPDTPNGAYTVHLRLADRNGQILGETDLGHLEVRGRAHHFQKPALQHPLDPPPQFDDLALLLGYDVKGEIQPASRLAITLTWQALHPAAQDYKISVQVLDGNNQVLAQEDHIPQRGAAPMPSWLPGEVIQDRFDLTLPEKLSPGPKRVIVLMYEADTLRRVPVKGGQGAQGDHVVLEERE